MKRLTALLISAGVTVLLVMTVLSVAQTRAADDTVQPASATTATSEVVLTADTAALEQQLTDAYALMQARDAQYQQLLDQAYAQTGGTQAFEHEDGDEHEARERHEAGEAHHD